MSKFLTAKRVKDGYSLEIIEWKHACSFTDIQNEIRYLNLNKNEYKMGMS